MARKKREATPENLTYFQRKYLINKIRQVSQWWPYKNKAKNKAKRVIEVGIYKNGKPRYVNKYECAECKGLFTTVEMDHIQPAVSSEKGFTDWSTYISRMLCDESNYQALCSPCHLLKSTSENKKRAKSRKKVK
jgi:5-methylcytosine-specific restriction endonuclease McrA